MGNILTTTGGWLPGMSSNISPGRLMLRADLEEDDLMDSLFDSWDEKESLERAITFLIRFGWTEAESKQFLLQRVILSKCEVVSMDSINHIPGGNIASLSEVQGTVATLLYSGFDRNERKTCQDRIICRKLQTVLLVGILDGHGPFGDDASQFVSHTLPRIIDANLSKLSRDVFSDPKNREIVTKVLVKSFKDMDTAMNHFISENPLPISRKNPLDLCVSWENSGTTCSIALIPLEYPNQVYTANLGDSRIILGNSDTQTAFALTKDHNWHDVFETERALQKNGLIESYRDPKGKPLGPPRLYSKSKKNNGPGLAVSRSFGDAAGHRLGVSSVPDITFISDRSQHENLIVLASDGIWDVMSGNLLIERLSKRDLSKSGLKDIVKECSRRWIYERKGICDDISLVVVKLD